MSLSQPSPGPSDPRDELVASPEALAEAAAPRRRELPRAVPPPDRRRRLPAVAAAGDPRRRHGARQDPHGDRRRPRGSARRAVPRDLPGVGEAQLAARDPARRARRRRPGARRRRRAVRARAPLDGRQLRPRVPPPRGARRPVDWAVVIVDEAHYIKNDSVRSRRTLELLGVAGKPTVRRPERRVPAHRDADGQPPARPVQPAQGGAPPAGDELLRLRQALLRGVRQRLRARRQRRVEPRRAGRDRVRGDAAAHQVRRPRPAREGALVGARRRADRRGSAASSSAPSTTSASTRPARGRRGCTFLGMLNRARHALAVAKAPATADFVTDCVEAGQKVVVFTSYTAVVDTIRERFGDACVTLTGDDGADGARRAPSQRFQTDDAVRVFVGNLARRRRRHHPHRRHPRRVQRPRLGAGQPLAGRGPHPPHRPDARRRSPPTCTPPARSTTTSPRCSSRRRPTIATLEDAAQRPRLAARRRRRPRRSTARRRRRRHRRGHRRRARRWACSTRPSTCSPGSTPSNSPTHTGEDIVEFPSASKPGRRLHACASPTASPSATAPGSPTGATASTAAR